MTAGKWLKVNAGGTALEETDAPSAGVTVSDAAPSTPSNGDLWFKSDEAVLKVRYEDGSSNQWVDALPMGNSTGAGGASVTIADAAPTSPSAGDMWWDSDDGRLKIYYTDATPDSQWVDASPLGGSSIANATTNGSNALTATTSTSGANANAIEIKTDNNTAAAIRWRFTPPGHFIPYANAQYDIGSAEYKVRHLFLSDNSLKFVDDNNTEHALSVSNNKLHYEGKEVLANCVFTGLDNNHTIKYNGTNWVNAAPEAPSSPAFQSNWRIPL